MAPLPFVVATVQDVVHPPQTSLRADPLQARIAVQYTREDEVGDELGLDREASGGTHSLFLITAITTPARHTQPQATTGMPVNGHVEILAHRPQRIPVRIVKVFQAFEVLAGLDQHDDTPVALLHGPLYFRHRDINAT